MEGPAPMWLMGFSAAFTGLTGSLLLIGIRGWQRTRSLRCGRSTQGPHSNREGSSVATRLAAWAGAAGVAWGAIRLAVEGDRAAGRQDRALDPLRQAHRVPGGVGGLPGAPSAPLPCRRVDGDHPIEPKDAHALGRPGPRGCARGHRSRRRPAVRRLRLDPPHLANGQGAGHRRWMELAMEEVGPGRRRSKRVVGAGRPRHGRAGEQDGGSGVAAVEQYEVVRDLGVAVHEAGVTVTVPVIWVGWTAQWKKYVPGPGAVKL